MRDPALREPPRLLLLAVPVVYGGQPRDLAVLLIVLAAFAAAARGRRSPVP